MPAYIRNHTKETRLKFLILHSLFLSIYQGKNTPNSFRIILLLMEASDVLQNGSFLQKNAKPCVGYSIVNGKSQVYYVQSIFVPIRVDEGT